MRRVCRSFAMRSGGGVFWSSDQEPASVLEEVLRPEHFIRLIEFTSDQFDPYNLSAQRLRIICSISDQFVWVSTLFYPL